jgi:hypothetical protein
MSGNFLMEKLREDKRPDQRRKSLHEFLPPKTTAAYLRQVAARASSELENKVSYEK